MALQPFTPTAPWGRFRGRLWRLATWVVYSVVNATSRASQELAATLAVTLDDTAMLRHGQRRSNLGRRSSAAMGHSTGRTVADRRRPWRWASGRLADKYHRERRAAITEHRFSLPAGVAAVCSLETRHGRQMASERIGRVWDVRREPVIHLLPPKQSEPTCPS
jgi:hypothetical protein